MPVIDEITRRKKRYMELVHDLDKDPNKTESIVRLLKQIEGYYYGDVRELLEITEMQKEQLEKCMRRQKILFDAFDKIINGEGNPIEIAVDACGEAITVRWENEHK